MSTKISALPAYNGQISPTGDMPISIGGVTYRIRPDQIAVNGIIQTIWANVITDGLVFNVPSLIGKSVKIVFRATAGGKIIFPSNTPIGNQILFNSITGDLTVASGNDWVPGEEVTIQFI